MTELDSIRIRLKNSLKASDMTYQMFETAAGIRVGQLSNFVNGMLSGTTPKTTEVVEKIKAEMNRRGWGHYPDAGHREVVTDVPPVSGTITPFLSDREKLFLAYAIEHAHGERETKDTVIKKLLHDNFPNL